jgi:transglutaminase-like putative cysteine protease
MTFEKRNGTTERVLATLVAAIILVAMIAVTIYYWPKNNENGNAPTQYALYSFNYTLSLTSDVAREIRLNCTIPTNTPNFQDIQIVNYSIDPMSVIFDENNNTIAGFVISLVPGTVSGVSIMVLAKLNKTSYSVSKSVPYDTSSQIYQQYTKPEEYVESNNQQIIEVAQNLATGDIDPVNVSRTICTWVHQNLTYSGFSSSARGALWALTTGNGDCTEYSDLFIALCRARGIPARFIDGISLQSINSWGNQSWEKIGHDWAEVYFQDVGWVWVDPTSGQFGCSDGLHLAIQLGQNCSSLPGGYRYSFTGSANVTENFELYPRTE